MIEQKNKNLQIHAIVDRKYIDSDNHNTLCIIFTELHGKKREEYFDYYHKQLYDYVQSGDTIIKDSGSLKIHVSNVNTDTVFNLGVR